MSARASRFALDLDDLALDPTPLAAAPAVPPAPGAAPAARLKSPVPAAAARRRRRPLARFAQVEESPSFYLSLSDLMSLLLVFFVLVYSLSGGEGQPSAQAQAAPAPAPSRALAAAPLSLPDLDPFAHRLPMPPLPVNAAVEPGMDGALTVASLPAPPPAPARAPEPAAPPAPAQPLIDPALVNLVGLGQGISREALPASQGSLSELLASLRKEVQEKGGDGVELEAGGDRVVLSLPEAITFDLGQAEIKPPMVATLSRLARVLAERPAYRVVVTGHTDDVPIANQRFASNWELSASRAAAVGRALLAQGLDAPRLSIRGLAEQAPRVPNDSPANRAQNRRVEIELRNAPAASQAGLRPAGAGPAA